MSGKGDQPVDRSPDRLVAFEGERQRLVGLASRVLADRSEAEDMVQQAWLRLERQEVDPENVPAWLTTVTTRLCLDRLKAKKPELAGDQVDELHDGVPAEHVHTDEDIAMAETVGVALQLVLDRLSPSERVAFVLHDSFGFDFETIAAILDTTPTASRKLASRARAKVRQPAAEDPLADWEVIDAFMAAARRGDFAQLMALLAPDVRVRADDAAVVMGTPERIDGADQVAAFFNGAAKAARPVSVDGRAGSAWFQQGAAKVLFDFVVECGAVVSITFRADSDLLGRVTQRDGAPEPS